MPLTRKTSCTRIPLFRAKADPTSTKSASSSQCRLHEKPRVQGFHSSGQRRTQRRRKARPRANAAYTKNLVYKDSTLPGKGGPNVDEKRVLEPMPLTRKTSCTRIPLFRAKADPTSTK